MQRIYLDWNATAPMLEEARDAMVRALIELPGNASSVHHEGQAARAVVERTRRSVAKALNAAPQAVVFTGGATEANNQVLRAHAATTEGAAIVCSAVEHPSVLEVVSDLGRSGVPTAFWPVDRCGQLLVDWLDGQPRPSLVSVMLANNETGVVFPIEHVAAQVRDVGALLHVDATQAIGRMPVDFAALGADLLTCSFHKAGGPKGIGAIVAREGLKVNPILAGGHQERGRRPGTENVAAHAGVGALCELVVERVVEWADILRGRRAAFLDELGRTGLRFEVRGVDGLPNTVNVAFEGIDGEDLLLALDLAGVAASSGSACTAGSLEPSHVLLAMGYDEADARRSVRFSFGPTTAQWEVVEAASRVASVCERLVAL